MNLFLKHRRTLILLAVDAFTITLSAIVGYAVVKLLNSVDNGIPLIGMGLERAILNCGVLCAGSLLGLAVCGAYRSLWRYASVRDLAKCVGGMIIGLAIYYIFVAAAKVIYTDTHIFITAMMSTLGLFLVRIGYNYVYTSGQKSQSAKGKKRTLIVGAGDAASRIIMEYSCSIGGRRCGKGRKSYARHNDKGQNQRYSKPCNRPGHKSHNRGNSVPFR